MSLYESVIEHGLIPAMKEGLGLPGIDKNCTPEVLELEAYRILGSHEFITGDSLFVVSDEEYRRRGLDRDKIDAGADESIGINVFREVNPSVESFFPNASIVKGASRALWVSEWASSEKEEGRSHGGCEIMDIMPEVPPQALQDAYRMLGGLESANGATVDQLLERAVNADQISPGLVTQEYAESFGHHLAMSALGSGVSWFDDHDRFDLIDIDFEPLLVSDRAAWESKRTTRKLSHAQATENSLTP